MSSNKNNLVRFADRFASFAEAISVAGLSGGMAYVMQGLGFPPSRLPQILGFGKFRDPNEFTNILDNFIIGRLRLPEIDEMLNSSPSPVIIDCGVNVGVTVRWWLAKNQHSKVICIDMIKEALDFTRDQLLRENKSALDRCQFVEAALGSRSGSIAISFNQALDGMNSVGCDKGKYKRFVQQRTLDDIVKQVGVERIDLIKIDIEGAGYEALRGGEMALSRTKHLVAEHHNAEELDGICRACIAGGLRFKGANEKMILFSREQQ